MSLPKKGMLTVFSRVYLKGMKVSCCFFFLANMQFCHFQEEHTLGGRETEKEIDAERVGGQEQEGKDYEIL